MNDLIGTEIEATAQWLEERGTSGAAVLLRRVARQRDQALSDLAAGRSRNYAVAWRSARHRARRAATESAALARQLDDLHARWRTDRARFDEQSQTFTRTQAMLRTDLARLHVQVERAGWIPDPEARRLWRWREDWWELGYRKKNRADGYADTGWYLFGPSGSGYFGEWTARIKQSAITEADRLITRHLTAQGEARP